MGCGGLYIQSLPEAVPFYVMLGATHLEAPVDLHEEGLLPMILDEERIRDLAGRW